MDIVSLILSLPLAPVRAVLAVGRVLQEEAERELYDPNRARRQLEDVEEREQSGEISVAEADQRNQEILDRMTRRRGQ